MLVLYSQATQILILVLQPRATAGRRGVTTNLALVDYRSPMQRVVKDDKEDQEAPRTSLGHCG